MTRKKEFLKRFGTFSLAMLFLITSVGFSVLVIWQVRQQNKQEAAQTQLRKEKEANMLQGKILKNFMPSTVTVTELRAEDIVIGTGEVVTKGALITAHYTGALVSTGIVFESSHDSEGGQPFSARLEEPSAENGGRGLIAGWVEGIAGMKVGGKRRLVIPYAKAYGEAGNPPIIPAKADLVFDIEIVSLGN